MREIVAALSLMGTLAFAFPGHACPDCAVGRKARSEVLSNRFSFHLLAAVLPFLVVAAICLRIEGLGNDKKDSP